MGMYDSVYATCPKCGKGLEFQSKAGACMLRTFSATRGVPPAIAADLKGQIEWCQCGAKVVLEPVVPMERVVMTAQIYKEDES